MILLQSVAGAAGRRSAVTASFKHLGAPPLANTRSHLPRLKGYKSSINIHNDPKCQQRRTSRSGGHNEQTITNQQLVTDETNRCWNTVCVSVNIFVFLGVFLRFLMCCLLCLLLIVNSSAKTLTEYVSEIKVFIFWPFLASVIDELKQAAGEWQAAKGLRPSLGFNE